MPLVMRVWTAIFACLFGCGVVFVPFVHEGHDVQETRHACGHDHGHDGAPSGENDAAPDDACAICAVAALQSSVPQAPPTVLPVLASGERLRAPSVRPPCATDHGPVLARGPPRLV